MTQDVIDAPVLALITEQAQAGVMPAPIANRPLTVIEHAARSGATPAEMRELMTLQVQMDNHQIEMMREKRRMDEDDRKLAAKLSFDAAMTNLRGHNIIVPKTKEVIQIARSGVPGPRFKQSEFDVVCRLLSPALNACGMSFHHDMRFGAKKWTTDGVESDIPWVYVTCYLTHRDGHAERLELEGPPDSSGSKNPLQEMQSTASYFKRQSLLAITGTATGGEDDENGMRGKRKPAPQGEGDQPSADDALLDVGREKSTQGMAALTAWWGALTEPQRKALTPEFTGLRKAARQFDDGGR